MTLKEALQTLEHERDFWVNDKDFSDYYAWVRDCPEDQLDASVDNITFDADGILTFEI